MNIKESSHSVEGTEEQVTRAPEQAELERLKIDLQRLRQNLRTFKLRNGDLESQVMSLGTKLRNERRAREALESRLNEMIDQLWTSIGDLAGVPKPIQKRTETGADSSDDELRHMREPPHSNPPMHFHEFADSMLRPRASDEAIGAAGTYRK
jgi:predicted RNase H-like nuclease (RuvC/YqgF family)